MRRAAGQIQNRVVNSEPQRVINDVQKSSTETGLLTGYSALSLVAPIT